MEAHVPPEQLAKSLPDVEDLCLRYNLEPETAFFITRSVLHLLYDDVTILNVKYPKKQVHNFSQAAPNATFLIGLAYFKLNSEFC